MRLMWLSALLLAVTIAPAKAADEKSSEHSAAEKQAIEQVRQSGGSVMEIAQNDNRLDVAYHLADGEVKDEKLAPLANMPKLYALNLRGTAITDAGLAHIANAQELVRLHLEKTAVGDEGLKHLAKLEKLE